ncbi:MAG: hypothetical protein OH318_01470 [Candidatus Parvarchaeota archaeon]|nr:hypothetical protein [Candidatus Rehaiarchaeum fermentans]
MNKGRILRKIAGLATGAMFLGSIMGAASVFAANSVNFGSLPSPFVTNGKVNSVIVIGANAAPTDVAGAISIASALTAAAAAQSTSSVTQGVVQVANYKITALSSAYTYYGSNSPLSVGPTTIYSANYTVNNANYTAQESLKISGAAINTTTLNVQIPVGGVSVTSAIYNASNKPVTSPFVGEMFYVGKTPYTVIDYALYTNKTLANLTFGVSKMYSNLKIPTSVTIGNNTVNLEGLVTQYTGTTATYELQVSVNGGPVTEVQLGKSLTIGKVTISPSSLIQNSSGLYLNSISLSYSSFVMNASQPYNGSMFGEPAYNVEVSNNALTFTYANPVVLPYSFTSNSGILTGFGLTNLTLFKLTPYSSSSTVKTINVQVGSPATLMIEPVYAYANSSANASSVTAGVPSSLSSSFTKLVAFSYSDNLPGVALGQSFRGTLTSSGVGSVPSLLILPNQSIYNISSGQYSYAQSGYIYPHVYSTTSTLPTGGQNYFYSESVYNWTSSLPYSGVTLGVTQGSSVVFPSANPAGSIERLLVRLPNGNYIGIQYKSGYRNVANYTVGSTHYYLYAGVWNVSELLLYNSSTTSSPQIINVSANLGKTYSYAGYNFTVGTYNITKNLTTSASPSSYTLRTRSLTITGPSVSITGSTTAQVLPGYAGVFSNGLIEPSLQSGYNSQLTYNGSVLSITLPDKETLGLKIAEHANNFTTYFVSPQNQTTMWGANLTVQKDTATIKIPTENYTLGIGGSKVLVGVQNYTVGSAITTTGIIKSISGVSSKINATNLYASGTSPANIMALSNEYNPSSASVPVIIVGGPAINPMAALALTGNETAIYGAKFENLTGVSNGESLIELFAKSKYFNNQTVMLVAGYSGNDTLEASQVLSMALIGEPVVSIPANATKVILKSGATYTGVSVVSS